MYKVLKDKEKDQYKDIIGETKKEDLIFVVERNGEGIDGYAILTLDGTIKKIYITKEKRFHSYGTKLIKFIKYYLGEKKVERLKAIPTEETKYFFTSAGFKKGKDGEYILDGLLKNKANERDNIVSTFVSIVINLFLAIFKIIFGVLGHSRALVADGFHSISDVVGSVVVLIGVYLGNKPADEKHPFGHGKLESVAGTIIGITLILTGYSLIVEDIESYIHKKEVVTPDSLTMIIVVATIIIKYLLYRYKLGVAKRTKSSAVMADAREHKSDIISSVAVLIGIALSIYVDPIFDGILSVVVGLVIGKEGFSIIMETTNELLDVQDKELVKKIAKFTLEKEEITNTHDIRMISSGGRIHISMHIRIDGSKTIREGHNISDDLKFALLSEFQELADVLIHIDCDM